MKKGILFIFILIISYSFYFADNMRNAADFFEWLLAEDYDRLLEHLSVQSVLDTEQLKKLSDELEAHYGFITSYLSCEQKEKLCALAVQMENAQVLVLFVFDEEGKIITLTVEPVENTIVKTSRIAIQTVPKEASVYINQVFKGWTPIVISDYPGVFELRIHKNGFLPLCQTLQLNHLDQADLTFQLIPSVRLHESDYMAAKSILLNSFDRGGWFTADWVTETVQGVVLSDEHVTQ